MGIFATTKERKTQLYFRDDNKFQFIPRILEFSCLIERDGEHMKKAWKHFYATELPFAGYKKLRSCMITIGFGRDIILDIFNRVPEGTGESTSEKPKKTRDALKNWIAKIAENQRQTYRVKRKTTTLMNRIIWTEIGVIFILAIVWAIRFATM